jgi:hypothetical protein
VTLKLGNGQEAAVVVQVEARSPQPRWPLRRRIGVQIGGVLSAGLDLLQG